MLKISLNQLNHTSELGNVEISVTKLYELNYHPHCTQANPGTISVLIKLIEWSFALDNMKGFYLIKTEEATQNWMKMKKKEYSETSTILEPLKSSKIWN